MNEMTVGQGRKFSSGMKNNLQAPIQRDMGERSTPRERWTGQLRTRSLS